MSAGTAPDLCPVAWRGRTVQIEHEWIAPERTTAPLMVFLHEGLGSVAMWRDFPAQLCDALGWRGLVYSRPGYGRSTPRAPDEHWTPDFMHQQALEILPALLEALGIDTRQQPPWLFGHSDGGSIALIHAAHFPQRVAGCVVVAPHILVEDISVRSIEAARLAFEQGDLRARLARHHDDPDSAFRGWNGAWLSPEFRRWSLAAELPQLTSPLLAVQGLNDEYGTLEQIRGIARAAPQTELLEIPNCGHSPHRDQPQTLIAAVQRFVRAG
jgi:pimeloyl-ACP methyl ester carboxylesterase